MAVITLTTQMAGAINYTATTASSSDWASVSNSTYFYDLTDKLVYYKNSSGTVLSVFSAGGLTYFTEAQSTSAPNVTVNVDSLTAVASTTNADLAIVPKGTGAFILAVPDSGITGGNKRGANAIDLQTSRTQALHVASADFSNLIGGYNNRATGTGCSVFGGYNNTSNGTYASIVGGYGNTNSGTYGSLIAGAENNNSGGYGASIFGWANTNSSTGGLVAGYGNTHGSGYGGTIGQSNTNNGSRAFVFGQSNNVTSADSFVSGVSNSVLSGGNNTVFGRGGTNISGSYGRFVFAGYNTVVGDAQNTTLILSRRTTDATVTPLTTDGGAVYFGVNEFKLQDNTCVRFKGSIVGKQTGTTNVGVWDIDGVVTRVNSVLTTTIVVGNVNVVTNASSWGVPTLTINASYGNLSVNVTGAVATNIQWVCYLQCTEVVY